MDMWALDDDEDDAYLFSMLATAYHLLGLLTYENIQRSLHVTTIREFPAAAAS
jgi:hypothetical protein